jgi:hypothetical protein
MEWKEGTMRAIFRAAVSAASRNIIMIVMTVMVTFVLAGCGSPGNSLVGSWRGEGNGPDGKPSSTTFTFRADGSFLEIVKVGPSTMEIKGTYTALDGKMSQTMESATENGKPIEQAGSRKVDLGYLIDKDTLTLARSGFDNVSLQKVPDK